MSLFDTVYQLKPQGNPAGNTLCYNKLLLILLNLFKKIYITTLLRAKE